MKLFRSPLLIPACLLPFAALLLSGSFVVLLFEAGVVFCIFFLMRGITIVPQKGSACIAAAVMLFLFECVPSVFLYIIYIPKFLEAHIAHNTYLLL